LPLRGPAVTSILVYRCEDFTKTLSKALFFPDTRFSLPFNKISCCEKFLFSSPPAPGTKNNKLSFAWEARTNVSLPPPLLTPHPWLPPVRYLRVNYQPPFDHVASATPARDCLPSPIPLIISSTFPLVTRLLHVECFFPKKVPPPPLRYRRRDLRLLSSFNFPCFLSFPVYTSENPPRSPPSLPEKKSAVGFWCSAPPLRIPETLPSPRTVPLLDPFLFSSPESQTILLPPFPFLF